MNIKEKMKELLHNQVDVWVDSLGDAVTVEQVCEVMKIVLRMSDVMMKLQQKLGTERKR